MMEAYPSYTTPLDPKLEDAPPMPDHWRIDEGTRFPTLKAALLFTGDGRRRMDELWARDRTLGRPFTNRGGMR